MINLEELGGLELYITDCRVPYTGLAVEESKKLKTVFSIENGLLHGPTITYVKRNFKEYLYEIEHFKRGERHGVCCIYNKKGRLATVQNFYHGRLEGTRLRFRKGRVSRLRNMDNYDVNGIESNFTDEGIVSKQTLVENNIKQYTFDDPRLPILKEKEDD